MHFVHHGSVSRFFKSCLSVFVDGFFCPRGSLPAGGCAQAPGCSDGHASAQLCPGAHRELAC